MLQLDSRLSTVASFVRPGTVVADIGTDHGYLVSYLLLNDICTYGYATDVNPLPLKQAKETIVSLGLSDKIELLLCDGLAPLYGKGIQDIVIAGMGGELISAMIEEAEWVYNPALSLVLQPMTRPEHLRIFLYNSGFTICREKAVRSGKHVYSVIQAQYTGKPQPVSLERAWLGELGEHGDEVTLCYFEKLEKRLGYVVRSEEDPNIRQQMVDLQTKLTRRISDADC